MFFTRTKTTLPAAEEALAGRSERPFHLAARHLVLDAPLVTDEVPEGYEAAIFGLGCFWGAEELYWQLPGRLVDVGRLRRWLHRRTRRTRRSARAAPGTPRPSASSSTRPSCPTRELVKRFFEVHDPTQGMRQGNDVGTQYRSAIYATTPGAGEGRPRADRGVRRRAHAPRLRPDHHRDQARRGRRAGVLLCRGLPPAVPREEPQRLPLPLHHGSAVPGRHLTLPRVHDAATMSHEANGGGRHDSCRGWHGGPRRTGDPPPARAGT